MHRAFSRLDEILNLVVARSQARVQGNGSDNKALTRLWLPRSSQAKAQQAIDGPFEGISRAAHLLFHELGYVVVDGKSGSHIMMLCYKAS